ncbi:F-box only protein 24 isoform X2 [Hyla sarda]|uniref:F-box only protein 24 isoform X2 n=1 Tax=Hyla sarda TaxID=327740 RepID=UPI0024C25872|nr:F-box only protein 24 isoform X2 [Hyla sarda]
MSPEEKRSSLDLTPTTARRKVTVQDLPPELVEHIISFLSVRDVVSLGETCHYLHQMCNSRKTWRSLCLRSQPEMRESEDWKRATILNYTKGMFLHQFARRQQVGKAVPPTSPNGFQRFLAMADNLCVLDYTGTLFYLQGSIKNPSFTFNNGEWRTYLHYLPLCRDVRDFTSDPRNDVTHRIHLYVLTSREVRDANQDQGQRDCVEIYRLFSGRRLFRMSFHLSVRIKKIVLLGGMMDRQLILLTEDGKVYSVNVNEMSLDRPRSYITQMTLRRMSTSHPDTTITQVYSNQSSIMYITDDGTVYLEVHSSAIFRDLFGTLQGYDSQDTQTPLAVSMPSKVVFCSLGYNHLALADEFGRIFMQGNNSFGQLGTRDKINRGVPCQIQCLRNPIDVFCGLNHTLVLICSMDSVKEIHGCGCGAGGRLPGWPQGSPSFVKLLVEVPVCARRIASTRDCLYIMSSYDPAENSGYSQLPEGGHREEDGAAQACEQCMNQLPRCTSVQERVAMTKDLIPHLPLQGYQKDCLWEALGMIQRAAERGVPARTNNTGATMGGK